MFRLRLRLTDSATLSLSDKTLKPTGHVAVLRGTQIRIDTCQNAFSLLNIVLSECVDLSKKFTEQCEIVPQCPLSLITDTAGQNIEGL